MDFSKLSSYQENELRRRGHVALEQTVETLRLYEPLPFQEAFHACKARVCVMQKANQVGGSLSSFVEVARAVTNQDPYGKYPKRGTFVLIGFGEKHIGTVIHNYLFESGPNGLQIIRDLHTGKWRIFRPWSGILHDKVGDKGREAEAVASPPLIPKRFYDPDKSIAWTDRRMRSFSRVDLNSGWVILAFNSEGDPKHAQGFQANGVLIDEDTASTGWVAEMFGRTMKPAEKGNGFIRWNALPHGHNQEMLDLAEEAERQQGQDNPSVELIKATIFDNPYISDEARNQNIELWKMQGEQEYRKRALGEFTLGELLVYQSFHPDTHGIFPWELPGGNADKKEAGRIPPDWCRYAVFDPGIQPASVLFAAVPPPNSDYGNMVLLYDELQVKNATVKKVAEEVKRRVGDQWFAKFILDERGSMSREQTSGVAVHKQYRKELRSVGLATPIVFGSTDVRGRIIKMQEMLHASPSGPIPAIRFVRGRLNTFEKEMRGYKWKVGEKGTVTDKPNPRGVHVAVCCEYLAAYQPKYRRPPEEEIQAATEYKPVEYSVKDRLDRLAKLKKKLRQVVNLA